MTTRRDIHDISREFAQPSEAAHALADAALQLVGHLHVDAASAAVARGAVGYLADVAAIDTVRDHGQVARQYSRTEAPREDAVLSERLAQLAPPFGADGSVLGRVLSEGRMVMRGEVGSDGAGHDSYSLIVLPVPGPDGVLAALTLVSIGRADRFGRAELRWLEAYAKHAGRALAAAQAHERTEAARMTAASHRDVLESTSRVLERSLAEVREELESLRAENAALRVLATSAERPDDMRDVLIPPAPSPVLASPAPLMVASGPLSRPVGRLAARAGATR
jgi:hypothetical protein